MLTRARLAFIAALVALPLSAHAGTSHFYVSARAFFPCNNSTAVQTSIGVDNKPAFTLIDADTACIETDDVWFPENISGTIVTLVPVFSTTATTGSACLEAGFEVSPQGANYTLNEAMDGTQATTTVTINQAAGANYYAPITNVQVYDQSLMQDCASVAACKNAHGILRVQRLQAGCTGDTSDPLTFTGLDFQYPSP